MPSLCAAHVGATSHLRLLGLGGVARGAEEVEFQFDLILSQIASEG